MMDPKLMEILKRAKAVDNATVKMKGETRQQTNSRPSAGLYDSIGSDIDYISESELPMTHTPSGGGLYDQMGISSGGGSQSAPVVERMDANSPIYQQSVENSKLPAAIKEAMKNNPIPQPDGLGGVDLDPEFLAEINPKMKQISRQSESRVQKPSIPEVYNEGDERDFYEHPIQPQVKPREIPRTQPLNESINVGSMRKMIAEEIAKALPGIIEDYFDKRVIKENVQFKAGDTTFSGTVSPLPKKRTKTSPK